MSEFKQRVKEGENGRTNETGQALSRRIERFDAEAALACCTRDMTQTEYPNMLTPMTRVRGLEEMGKGVLAAEAMLVEQSYEIIASHDAGAVLAM